jgi:hypothetical protein
VEVVSSGVLELVAEDSLMTGAEVDSVPAGAVVVVMDSSMTAAVVDWLDPSTVGAEVDSVPAEAVVVVTESSTTGAEVDWLDSFSEGLVVVGTESEVA